jgi:hypothetical protein
MVHEERSASRSSVLLLAAVCAKHVLHSPIRQEALQHMKDSSCGDDTTGNFITCVSLAIEVQSVLQPRDVQQLRADAQLADAAVACAVRSGGQLGAHCHGVMPGAHCHGVMPLLSVIAEGMLWVQHSWYTGTAACAGLMRQPLPPYARLAPGLLSTSLLPLPSLQARWPPCCTCSDTMRSPPCTWTPRQA